MSKLLMRSFAGGEITPELYGRLDLAKRQTGLSKCLNFETLPHGPAQRRPGFRYIAEARDSTQAVRAIPFAFSAEQTAVLEFGDEYIRVQVNGGTLLETARAITSIVGSTVTMTLAHSWTTGDDVYIGNRFHRITVTGATTFTTRDRWAVATTAAGTTAARAYTIATTYQAADLFDLHYAQDSDVLTITHPDYPAAELRRLGAANWTLTTVSFAPTLAAPGGVGAAATQPTAGTTDDHTYVVTTVDADGVTESVASAEVTAANALNLAGNFNTITWSAVVGALRYNVFKQKGGTFGFIGRTAALTLIDNNVTADTLKTPPESVYDLNSGSGDYPSAVTHHEQRRWFAGTGAEPQTVWATRNGTLSNLTSSVPSQDDDAMEFRIAARQQNAIRHLVPLSDMIALTVGGEFRVYADNAPAITPTSLSVKPQGFSGANGVQPALTSSSLLYVQSQGSRIRELMYSWQSNAYNSIDISLMAPHLFNGYTIVDIAYVRAPVPSLWCVRSDGVLLGMTYVPEQQVYGWHQHTTAGTFKSVCVVAEGDEDVLYAVVERTVNARTVKYIERKQTAVLVDQADSFYVDSGLTYDSTPVTSVSGLWHLEGRTVQVLTDGAEHPERVVTAGAVALAAAASVVHVGLGYNSDLVTLPLALESVAAGGQGITKNVNGLAMRVTQSALVKAGPSFDDLTEYPARDVTDDYDAPPALRTGELQFDIGPDWGADGQISIRQDKPLPLTVVSIVPDVATGG